MLANLRTPRVENTAAFTKVRNASRDDEFFELNIEARPTASPEKTSTHRLIHH
ncbi:MAG: hypothetical protein V4819_14455 [Verrucomicrobiota bacterium]